jgi:pyruvate dehydrogenase phosphatase
VSPCSLTSVDINRGPTWSFLGLFDPHNGYDNMGFVSSRLIPTVTDALFNLLSMHGSPSTEHVEVGMSPLHTPQATSEEPFPDAVDNTIKKAFLDVDCAVVDHAAEIIFSSPSKAAAIIPLSVALSGTSALLTFYDHDTQLLKVAVAGSSRAVLGRRAERKNQDQRSSYYEVHVLTTDQLRNSFDQAQHVHSGSDEAMPTRGFGLSAYKWSDDIQERLHQEYLGDAPTPHIKMCADPEITTIEVKPGDFLIMASAGLWQSLTSEEAVGLVGLWLDKGMYHALPSVTTPIQQLPTLSSVQITHPRDLPVSLGAKDETVMYRKWGAEKRFVCIDMNAAGHLTRNALGGADGDLMEALLTVEPPLSRKLRWVGIPCLGQTLTLLPFDRSDISTAVIFFDGQL